ncbi:MAG TPA: hypothetical protein VHX38_02275 [Pseudonocardiaceae bacterium]|jgi:hypothetical protein|nr:hypothetical protein [Pseudonocardiaceae bacterium]
MDRTSTDTTPPTDTLAEFAARDQAVRDRIRTVQHRSYTHPSYYSTYLAEAIDCVEAQRALYDLILDMQCSGLATGVLGRVLADASVSACTQLREDEKHLASLQQHAQTAAYVSYRDNLAVAS